MTGESPADLDPESEAFLLAEFETLRDMRASLNSLVATEIQIYVAMVAATFVALAFIGQLVASVTDTVLLIALGALIAVVLLGWATYFRVVDSRVTVVEYARSLNRIRNYYVTREGELTQYVSPNIYDDRPPFGAVGLRTPIFGALLANTGLIAIINSGATAASVGTTAKLFNLTDLVWMSILVAGAFLISIVVHQFWQERKYKLAEANWHSYHPKPSG